MAQRSAWIAAVTVTILTAGLVALDVADAGVDDWFDRHAFTASTLSGVLVLAVTVLIVDRVRSLRARGDRAVAVAAQAGLVQREAQRAVRSVRDALGGEGDRDAASDEIRTYMTMLLISAPILIDSPQTRGFLEAAERLATALLRLMARTDSGAALDGGIDERLTAMARAVGDTARPLLAPLDHAERVAVDDAPSGSG